MHPLPTLMAALVVLAALAAGDVAPTSQSILVLRRNTGTITAINFDGTASQDLYSFGEVMDSIASDGISPDVFVASADGVFVLDISTRTATLFVEMDDVSAVSVGHLGEFVFVVGPAEVWRIDRADAAHVVQVFDAFVEDVVRFHDALFFATGSELWRSALDGSGARLLPGLGTEVRTLAVSDAHVFFAGRTLPTIQRMRGDDENDVAVVASGISGEPRDVEAGVLGGATRVCWLDTIGLHVRCKLATIDTTAEVEVVANLPVDAFAVTFGLPNLVPTPTPTPSPVPVPVGPTPVPTPNADTALLFVADRVGNVFSRNADGSALEFVLSGVSPHGVAVNTNGTRLFVTDRGNGVVLARDFRSFDAYATVLAKDLAAPEGIFLDEENDMLYFTDDSRIARVSVAEADWPVEELVDFGLEVTALCVHNGKLYTAVDELELLEIDLETRTTVRVLIPVVDDWKMKGITCGSDNLYLAHQNALYRMPYTGEPTIELFFQGVGGRFRGINLSEQARLICAPDAVQIRTVCVSLDDPTQFTVLDDWADTIVFRDIAVAGVPGLPNGVGVAGKGLIAAFDASTVGGSGAAGVAPHWLCALLLCACALLLVA